jgi:hypothetical protein
VSRASERRATRDVLGDGDVFAENGRVALKREGGKIEKLLRVDTLVEEDGRNLRVGACQTKCEEEVEKQRRTFQVPGKLSISSSETGRTRKSLKRCQEAPDFSSSETVRGRGSSVGVARKGRSWRRRTSSISNEMRSIAFGLNLHDGGLQEREESATAT